jgi:hypothetical protein
MCDWQWELTPHEKTDEISCKHCGSNDLIIEKQDLHMLKKGGKFVTDIGFSHPRDKFGATPVEEVIEKNKEPILVVRHDDIKISENITNEDLKDLLGKINSIRNRIIDEVEVDHEELMKRLS